MSGTGQTPNPGEEPGPGLKVDLPRSGIPGWLLLPAGLVFAVGLFALLESRREARLSEGIKRGASTAMIEAPPPLVLPPAPPEPTPAPSPSSASTIAPSPPIQSRIAVPPPPYLMPPPQIYRPIQPPADDVYAPPRHSRTPAVTGVVNGAAAMVVDLTAGNGVSVSGGAGVAAAAIDDDAVRATIIRNRASVVQQGVVIAAVLETPLNSDRPGLARAIVSQDVRGFDGTRVLIPKGSRLIGEFKAESGPNLRRILVTWSRLIRPDGVAIRIASPSADRLGGSGVPGSVNTHFFERFSGAVLQSALMVGVNLASQLPKNGSNVYIGVPGQLSQIGQELLPDSKRAPTVKVKAGAEIAIFVAHDLDFGGTPAVR